MYQNRDREGADPPHFRTATVRERTKITNNHSLTVVALIQFGCGSDTIRLWL